MIVYAVGANDYSPLQILRLYDGSFFFLLETMCTSSVQNIDFGYVRRCMHRLYGFLVVRNGARVCNC